MRVVRLKIVIVALSLIVLGGVLLWYSTSQPGVDSARLVAGELSSILLISGIWTVIQEYFVRADFEEQKRELVDRIDALHQLAIRTQGVGLVDVLADSRTRGKGPIIETARHLVIVMNDGRTLVGANLISFQRRFSKPETVTKYVLVHPDSDYVPILARKTGETRESVRAAIFEACKLLTSEHLNIPEHSRGALEIYGHHMPSMFASFITESSFIMIPYVLSNHRTHVPLFEFEPKGSDMPYEHYRSDIETLMAAHAELLYRNGEFYGALKQLESGSTSGSDS